MHIKVVIAGLQLIELIRSQCRCRGPDAAACFGFSERKDDRSGDTTGAQMNVRLSTIDVRCHNGGFHSIVRRVHAHDTGTGAGAGDTRDFFSAGQRAGKYILRCLAVDGINLADLRSGRADRIVITAAARQHQQ